MLPIPNGKKWSIKPPGCLGTGMFPASTVGAEWTVYKNGKLSLGNTIWDYFLSSSHCISPNSVFGHLFKLRDKCMGGANTTPRTYAMIKHIHIICISYISINLFKPGKLIYQMKKKKKVYIIFFSIFCSDRWLKKFQQEHKWRRGNIYSYKMGRYWGNHMIFHKIQWKRRLTGPTHGRMVFLKSLLWSLDCLKFQNENEYTSSLLGWAKVLEWKWFGLVKVSDLVFRLLFFTFLIFRFLVWFS